MLNKLFQGDLQTVLQTVINSPAHRQHTAPPAANLRKKNMAFAGADSLYITLTSETNKKAFPENKAANFVVQLGQQITLDPELWEVGLFSLMYPYSFNTIPNDCNIHIRHGLGGLNHGTVEIPQEHFPTPEALKDFINAKLHKMFSKPGTKKIDAAVKMHFDGMKRAKFTFQNENSDIGFSPSAAYILGFVDHPEHSQASMKNRERLRILIERSSRPAFIKNLEPSRGDMHVDPAYWEAPDMIAQIQSDPEFIYSLPFMLHFMFLLRIPRENLFERICEGIHNPFTEPIPDTQAELFADERIQVLLIQYTRAHELSMEIREKLSKMKQTDQKVPGLTMDLIYSENNRLQVLGELQKIVIEGVNVKENIPSDWYKDSKYADFFELHDVQTFVQTFEQFHGVPETERSTFEPGLARFSKWYTFAVSACLFANYLKPMQTNLSKLTASRPALINPYEVIYVYGDFVKPEPFNDVMAPLLAIVRTEGTPGNMTQFKPSGNLQYKRLQRANIGTMKINIASDLGNPVPFLSEPSVVELHFRRRVTQRIG